MNISHKRTTAAFNLYTESMLKSFSNKKMYREVSLSWLNIIYRESSVESKQNGSLLKHIYPHIYKAEDCDEYWILYIHYLLFAVLQKANNNTYLRST